MTRYIWEAIATHLFEAGHRISVINPAQIHAFGQSRLQRNKTDGLDAALIAQYCAQQHPPAWQPPPIEDHKLLLEIKQFYDDSYDIYGSPRIHRDLREAGISCGVKLVARLMQQAKLKSIRGYRRPRYKAGKPAVASPNRLQQQFTVSQPDMTWVTYITYISTYEGWLYLAVVIDLYSRTVVGWSMRPTMATEIVLDALLMAVWRRKPKQSVIIHSDQGSQYGSDDFARWCKDNNLVPSMSRRGNCYDNAVAESFFSNLKKERVKRKV